MRESLKFYLVTYRTDSKGIDVEVINSLLELPKANEVLLSHGLTCKNKATGTEDLDKKSMFSKTMTQETNNEQIQETVTRETNTENFLLTPAAVFVAGGGTKLGWIQLYSNAFLC